jgi:hypothetical protein
MLRLFILLFLILGLQSCGGKPAGVERSFEIQGIMGLSGAQGGLFFAGRSAEGEEFRMAYDNVSSQVSMHLKSGSWTFYAIAWDGPAPLEGMHRCVVRAVNLTDESQTVNLDLTRSGCNDARLVNTSSDSQLSGLISSTQGFKPLHLNPCMAINFVTNANSDCRGFDRLSTPTPNASQLHGDGLSYRVVVRSRSLEGSTNQRIQSLCIKQPSMLNLRSSRYPTNLRLPFGGSDQIFPFEIVSYRDFNCQDPEGVYSYSNIQRNSSRLDYRLPPALTNVLYITDNFIGRSPAHMTTKVPFFDCGPGGVHCFAYNPEPHSNFGHSKFQFVSQVFERLLSNATDVSIYSLGRKAYGHIPNSYMGGTYGDGIKVESVNAGTTYNNYKIFLDKVPIASQADEVALSHNQGTKSITLHKRANASVTQGELADTLNAFFSSQGLGLVAHTSNEHEQWDVNPSVSFCIDPLYTTNQDCLDNIGFCEDSEQNYLPAFTNRAACEAEPGAFWVAEYMAWFYGSGFQETVYLEDGKARRIEERVHSALWNATDSLAGPLIQVMENNGHTCQSMTLGTQVNGTLQFPTMPGLNFQTKIVSAAPQIQPPGWLNGGNLFQRRFDFYFEDELEGSVELNCDNTPQGIYIGDGSGWYDDFHREVFFWDTGSQATARLEYYVYRENDDQIDAQVTRLRKLDNLTYHLEAAQVFTPHYFVLTRAIGNASHVLIKEHHGANDLITNDDVSYLQSYSSGNCYTVSDGVQELGGSPCSTFMGSASFTAPFGAAHFGADWTSNGVANWIAAIDPSLAPGPLELPPVVYSVNPSLMSNMGGTVYIYGANLEQVTYISVDGIGCTIDASSDNTQIICTLGAGVWPGLSHNMHLISSSGTLIIHDAIMVYESPVVTSISPNADLEANDTITITGYGFTNVMNVRIGGDDCISFSVLSDIEIACEVPDKASGSHIMELEKMGESFPQIIAIEYL